MVVRMLKWKTALNPVCVHVHARLSVHSTPTALCACVCVCGWLHTQVGSQGPTVSWLSLSPDSTLAESDGSGISATK